MTDVYCSTTLISDFPKQAYCGGHSTQKPVSLEEYLIKTYTASGNIVMDCFMGSGSTGVACVNTGRKFIGIELDDHYFEVARERIAEAVKEKGMA